MGDIESKRTGVAWLDSRLMSRFLCMYWHYFMMGQECTKNFILHKKMLSVRLYLRECIFNLQNQPVAHQGNDF
jgi:hypothetical protein